MRASRFFAVAIVVLAACVPAAGQTCNPEDQLQSYVKRKFPRCPRNLVVLAYKHPAPTPLQDRSQLTHWLAARLQPQKDLAGTCSLTRIHLETDLNGKPRLSLGNKDELLVVVYDTNSMLYTVDPGLTVEADIESLAQFKEFAGLIGGNVTGALRLIDRFEPAQVAGAQIADAAGPEAALQTIKKKISEILARKADSQRDALAALDSKRRILEAQVAKAEVVTLEARAYLRAIEDGRPVEKLIKDIVAENLDEGIETAGVELARVRLEALEPGCQASFATASAALSRKVRGFTAEGQAQEKEDFLENLLGLDDAQNRLDRCDDKERSILADLEQWLRQNPPAEPGITADPLLQNDVQDLKVILDDYLQLGKLLTALRTDSAKLLAELSKVIKLAESLQTLVPREAKYISATDATAALPSKLCSLSAGVIEIFDGDPEVRVLKFQTRKFTLTSNAPLAGDLERHRRDELKDVEFALDSKLVNDFSFGFGVLYHSDTVNRTWSAVTAESQKADEEDPPAPPKYIGQTDEKSLTGDTALIMSFVPRQPERFFRWGIDLGGALSTDNPGILVGLSTSLGRFARLGFGYSWTKVKELDGQEELRFLSDGTVDPRSTQVTADTDIRRRDKYEGDIYFSLTFSVDALPFFAPNE